MDKRGGHSDYFVAVYPILVYLSGFPCSFLVSFLPFVDSVVFFTSSEASSGSLGSSDFWQGICI